MTNSLPILTDRSRILDYQVCNRLRYWKYHVEGIGLEPARANLALTVGICVHKGLEYLLKDAKDAKEENHYSAFYWIESVNKSIVIAQQEFDRIVTTKGLKLEDINESFAYLENRSLIEVLLRVYAKVELPRLLEQYEVLEVEKEINLPLLAYTVEHTYQCIRCGTMTYENACTNMSCSNRGNEDGIDMNVFDELSMPPLILMSRPDAILRDKSTGKIYVLSYKTAGEYYTVQDKKNKWDVQSISEVLATEYWLTHSTKETLDEVKMALPSREVSGVLMAYLIKGKHMKAIKDHPTMNIMAGTRYYNNPILHPYKDTQVVGLEIYEPEYEYINEWGDTKRLGKGYKRINAWEEGETFIADWIENLAMSDRGSRILESMMFSPPVFKRSTLHIERWKRQVIAQETRIANTLFVINNPEGISLEDYGADVNVALVHMKMNGIQKSIY